jgi:electron transfer flavoprotein alpha subunit
VATLVFLEHHGDAIQKGSLGVLAKAASLSSQLGGADAVIAGEGAKSLAAQAGRYGAAKVWTCEDAEVAQPLPQPRVDVIAQVVADGGYDTVLFANSVLAADVAAGLAARLDAGLNWDLVDLVSQDGSLVGKRPALQDSVYVDVAWTSEPRLGLFRAGSFDATASGGGEPQVVEVAAELEEHSRGARVVEQQLEESTGPSIEDAEIVVAGGRGLGAPESFTLAEELAKALGGAVGATRAVVDAGWYPYSAQIGQTGKTVSPKLYVALGISGAIQHKVGMQGSNVIVAINKDANAPIFEFSDLGVVGDVHEIVPKLTELIRQRKS